MKVFGKNNETSYFKTFLRKIKIITLFFLLFSNSCFGIENKIILKIDNDTITSIDIYDEINYLKFFNKNLDQIKDPEIYKIAIQSLINYKIKSNYSLTYNDYDNFKNSNEEYFNTLLTNQYKNMGYQSLLNFKKALDNNKVNFNYHKEKIITDLFWNQIIFSKYSNKIVINEKKLEEKIKNQKNTVKLYNLDEIVFQVDDIKNIQKKFDLIQDDINNLGFENAVLKYSVSDSMANKGKLGWVDQKSINSIILNELDLIPIGSTTKPIRIASGFLILKKNEIKVIDKKININEELKKLIEFEKNQQLRNYSNLYFNKVKKNSIINEP